MELYFEKSFSGDAPLFNKNKVKLTDIDNILNDVTDYSKEFIDDIDTYYFNHVMVKFYNIDRKNDNGIFVYYWLNTFIREFGYMIWNHIYNHTRKTENEKVAGRTADNWLSNYHKDMKEKFK